MTDITSSLTYGQFNFAFVSHEGDHQNVPCLQVTGRCVVRAVHVAARLPGTGVH